MHWTEEQDEILYTYGNLGVEELRRLLHSRCGVIRSEDAIKRHAYRIGASLIRYEVCVNCGRRVQKLKPDNLCTTCHTRRLTERQHQRNAKLMQELREREEQTNEYKAAQRAYNAAKKANSRLCKKHDLSGKR